jgi:hypothetical protein
MSPRWEQNPDIRQDRSVVCRRIGAVPAERVTGRVSQHLMHGHLRSPPYFAASCGGAPLPVIKQYIEQQKRPGQTNAIPPGPELNSRDSSHLTIDDIYSVRLSPGS